LTSRYISLALACHQPEAAAFDRARLVRFAPRDHVDRAADGIGTEERRPWAVQNFNPLNEIERDRDIAIVMARLRIVQSYAVNEHQHLAEGRSAKREVGLNAAGAARTNVDRRREPQDVRDAMHR